MAQSCSVGKAQFSEDVNVSVDGSGPISRSSVTHVAYTVAKFDDAKKNLVREIGFNGILDLPQIPKVDRKFTLWLLSKLDAAKKSIIVNGHCITEVIDFEVSRIMGIPCGGREVCSLDAADKRAKTEFIRNFIGSTDPDSNSLTAAENNVTAQYGLPMTTKDMDNFKVSFVVWVMGHLLAPTKNHNVGSDKFWGALISPDEIDQFNWANYVIDELMIAAHDVQNALKLKKPINAITGCSILLQILYFESINMGSLNRPTGICPRVKVYDSKSLSLMIAADKASSATGSGNATWGSSVRCMPGLPNQSLPLASDTDHNATNNNTGPQNRIIDDFGTYVRDKFGEKVSLAQSVALSWFLAKARRHHQQMMLSIQEDTIALVGKLFGSPVDSIHAGPPEPFRASVAARQAHSEPGTAAMCAVTYQKNKRRSESCTPLYRKRGNKKQRFAGTHYTLPETLLTGMSISEEPEADGEISDTDHHSWNISHNTADDRTSSACNIEAPSFDLGLELNTQVDEALTGCTIDKLIHNSAAEHPSDLRGNANVKTELVEASRTPKNTMISIVSVNDSSNNSISNPNDFCVGSSRSVNSLNFNALSGTPASAKNIEPPVFVSPDPRFKGSSKSPGSLSKILAEGDLVERITRSEDSPNINIKSWDDDYSESPISKRTLHGSQMPPPPHSCNLCHRNPPRDIVDKFYDDVSLCSYLDLNRPWLAHNLPRQIELDGTWIHNMFTKEMSLSYDVCDLAIRRLRQLDDMMYSDPCAPHWRHILESEFAMFALADEIPYNRKSIIEQFIGSSIQYQLEDCCMIVVPAYVLLNWSCYFFDFKDNCVHVIDPLYKKEQQELFEKMHLPNISKVAVSLANCFERFFLDWSHDMQDWDVVFVEPSVIDATSSETGILTLFYIRQFDGSKLHLATREHFLYFKKVMLYELMCLSENHVKAPVNITISLDD